MPSSNTITSTAITSFTAGTTIKSAEVNGNLNVWRGHLLPVDLTASAAAPTQTFDVGSTDYRFRNIFGSSAPNVVSTTGSISPVVGMDAVLMNTTSATTTA